MRSFFLFLFFVSSVVTICPGQSTANLESVPRLVKFSGTAPKGTHTITFAIYSTRDGLAPLWLETQSVTTEDDGRYSVLLGTTKSDGVPAGIFASGEARWIGVRVDDAPENERILLLSVPYALKALDAETLGGMPASSFLQVSASRKEITKAQPESSVAVNTTSGSQGSVPMFTDNNGTLGNSLLFQSGNSIGMGRSPVITGLDVNGGVRANTGLATGGRNISDDAINTNALFIDGSNALGFAGTNNLVVGAGGIYKVTSIYAASQEMLTLNGLNGNIGIGNPSPSAKLDVAGVFKVDSSGTVFAAAYKDQNGNPLSIQDTNAAHLNVDNTFLFNQTINGQLNVNGLLVGTLGAFTSSSAGNTPVAATTDGTTALPGFNGFAIKATSSGFGTGVYSELNGSHGTGTAVWGIGRTDFGNGVKGEAYGIGGIGVTGVNYATTSNTVGVAGGSYSVNGTGVEGDNLATTGITTGVKGRVDSALGIAGVFFNTAGGPILEGDGITSSVFTVSGNGLVTSKAGFKYPDGTIQTTAAGGLASITAGSGLSGGTITTSGTIAVDSTVVRTSDSRLTDARTPVAGSNLYIQNGPGSPQVANINVSGSVTAATFIGDGNLLTDIHQLTIASSDPPCNGSSNGWVYFNTVTKTLRYCDGTQFTDLAPKLYSDEAKYCGSTLATAGQINSATGGAGYRQAKLACESACGSANAHMCTAPELVRGSQLGSTQPAAQSWYADGATDCSGWSSTSGSANTWNGNINSGIAACSSSLPIACCK